MRRLFIVLAFMLWLPVAAQDSDKGKAALDRGNYATALMELRPLAEQGDASAQYSLGLMHEYGQGVRQDDAEAVEWYRKAAMQGVALAQYKLGVMYDNSWGVPRNDIEAVKWYAKAAVQGHPLAKHDLALMYASGAGVPKDYVRAHMWLNIAVAFGNSFMVKHRNRIAKKMTPTQIAEAERLAREWMEKHGK